MKRAMNATSMAEDEKVSKKWDAFDTELSSALFQVATGSIGRELLLYREKCSHGDVVATDLARLLIVLQPYEIEKGQALRVDMEVLLAHRFHGNLEEYLERLDSKLSMMTKEPDLDLLRSSIPK